MKRFLVLTLLMLIAFSGASFAAADEKTTPPTEPKIKVGDIAPDFTLLDSTGKAVSLHDFKGKKNVALGFYIFAFTGG